jgi:ankyrin repeat protein
MMNFLFANGAVVDFRIGDNWKTPLHVAAEKNKPLALKVNLSKKALLDNGAFPNITDSLGLTPLFYAATSGSTECVLRLLLAGAVTEIFDDVGKGPLHQVP